MTVMLVASNHSEKHPVTCIVVPWLSCDSAVKVQAAGSSLLRPAAASAGIAPRSLVAQLSVRRHSSKALKAAVAGGRLAQGVYCPVYCRYGPLWAI